LLKSSTSPLCIRWRLRSAALIVPPGNCLEQKIAVVALCCFIDHQWDMGTMDADYELIVETRAIERP
jgi:hypothetical protein